MKVRVTDREGFVIPAVIFALAIMGVLAAALRTADDEHRSSRALRESGGALYAAEAGSSIVRGTVTDTSGTTRFDSVRWAYGLEPGDSTDLDWVALPDNSIYRTLIRRLDSGGPQLTYILTAEGRSSGLRGGQRAITMVLTGHEGQMPTVNSVIGSSDGGGSPPFAATLNGVAWLVEGKDTQMPSDTIAGARPPGCTDVTSENKLGFGVASTESKTSLSDAMIPVQTDQFRGRMPGTDNDYTNQNSYDTVQTSPADSVQALVDILLPTATIWPTGSYSATYGSPTQPGVWATTDGDLRFFGTGYGIIIVTAGTFIMNGNAYWEGLILAVGPGSVQFTGSGNEFYGAIMLANTWGGTTDLNISGDAQIHYSSQALCRLEEYGLIGMNGIRVVPGTWMQLSR